MLGLWDCHQGRNGQSGLCGMGQTTKGDQAMSSKVISWRPISTAPKDGTWVLLTGGRDGGYDNIVGPCVVAFWDTSQLDDGWAYCYWDGGWGSAYENPSHWMPIPEPPGGDIG